MTFSVALGALVFAVIRAPGQGWTSGRTVGLYAVSAVFLVLFLLIGRRLGERAMIGLGFFRNPTFVGVSLVALLGNAAALLAVFFETGYLENVLHNDAWDTGLRFLPLTGAMFVAGAIGGALIGKVPFRVLLGGSTLVMAAGLLLLQRTQADSSWTVLVPSLIVAGLGMGLFNLARAALAIGVAEPARSGVASGIDETFQQIGIAVGIAGVGAYFEHRVAADVTASRAGGQLGHAAAERAAHGISAGSPDAVAKDAGAPHDQVLTAGRDAFMTAFHDAMALCAGLGSSPRSSASCCCARGICTRVRCRWCRLRWVTWRTGWWSGRASDRGGPGSARRWCGGAVVRCCGAVVRWCGGAVVRCCGAAVRWCGGAVVRCGGAVVRCGGAAVRCGGAAVVRCGGAVVRCGGAAVLRCGGAAALRCCSAAMLRRSGASVLR